MAPDEIPGILKAPLEVSSILVASWGAATTKHVYALSAAVKITKVLDHYSWYANKI